MINYQSKASNAKKTLDRFGSFGYVKLEVVESVADPINGDTVTTTEVDLTAVDLRVTKDLLQAGIIESTDRMVITSSDIKPKMDDRILIGDVSHKIIEIMSVSPAGVDVIYKIICRA